MLDINIFRTSPDTVRKDLKRRAADPSIVSNIIGLDNDWKAAQKKTDELKHERNETSKQINEMKKAGKKADKEIANMRKVNAAIEKNEKNADDALQKRNALLLRVPNLLHKTVPSGNENKTVRKHGKPSKSKTVSHAELAERLGLADFDNATKIAGSGFYALRGSLALMDQALSQFAIAELTKKGYTFVIPPFMMNRASYEGVTDIADFEDVMYKIDNEDLYLIATAEHPLAAMFQKQVIPEDALPLKLCGLSTNFRKEVGAHGIDTKGLFRVHQFNKVEQFIFSTPDESYKLLEELISNAEYLFKKLEIPYRVVSICTGDIGTVAAKKYDLEVWSPRQEKYVELVSASNCTDYQSRRLNIKYGKRGGETKLAHTLNATAIATTRTMVAILENFQKVDKVVVPKALRPFMHGLKEL